jgi:hypothetical protein
MIYLLIIFTFIKFEARHGWWILFGLSLILDFLLSE